MKKTSKEICIKNLSERLSLLISQQNITHQSLANELGVKRQAVSQFANGNNFPSIPTLISIADFFGVSVDYLLGRTDDP